MNNPNDDRSGGLTRGPVAARGRFGLQSHLDRRGMLAGSLLFGLGLNSVGAASAAVPADLEVVPPGVGVLRVVEVTEEMETLLYKAAAQRMPQPPRSGKGGFMGFFSPRSDVDETEEIAIERLQMQQSIDVLLKKTRIADIPNSRVAVETLQGVSLIAEEGEGALTGEELRQMAQTYAQARRDLRRLFRAFSQEEQREFKDIFRRMQKADLQLIQESQSED